MRARSRAGKDCRCFARRVSAATAARLEQSARSGSDRHQRSTSRATGSTAEHVALLGLPEERLPDVGSVAGQDLGGCRAQLALVVRHDPLLALLGRPLEHVELYVPMHGRVVLAMLLGHLRADGRLLLVHLRRVLGLLRDRLWQPLEVHLLHVGARQVLLQGLAGVVALPQLVVLDLPRVEELLGVLNLPVGHLGGPPLTQGPLHGEVELDRHAR
mmetsp:Transcript_41290/g.93861  ORF Transcript_41290/g.93861 Transcript_41290/m.93861 type:complete len:215 (+) Transcript_41290:103-747(+)